MAELGNQTVALSTLLSSAAEDSFTAFQELVENSKSLGQSDSDKKISLLKYFVKTQQRMLRLNVLAKWCQQVPLIQYCQQLSSTLSSHDMCFTQASDSLYFMHEGLQQAQAPIYDVPSAVEVFLTGGYSRLPKCIEDVAIQNTLSDDLKKPALKKLDMLVRSKLLEISLPKDFSEVKICDGTALFRVDAEFQCLVTLGYRGHLSLWRILHMDLLVGERGVPVKLEESQRHILGDDLERRMAAAENPFVVLYSRLHELCVTLSMDTVIKQVQSLRQDRWKDTIKFELTSDNSLSQGSNMVSVQTSQDSEADWTGLRTPGVKIMYWLHMDKNTAFDTTVFPFLKIEPGPDLQIKCSHSTFIVDPHSGTEAELELDLSCIDVEKLLLKALFCNRYTRLLEIQRDLSKNVQICKVEGDVILKRGMDQYDICSKKECTKVIRENEGQEVLLVRAYNKSYFTLAINIRTGRFLLHSSKNVISFTMLLEYEEALNQGSINVVDVFINLRRKSILLLFASIGKFQGLEVYDHWQTVIKVPKNIPSGSDLLVTGFADCGGSYFLLIHLDKSFNPVFNLLERCPDPILKLPSCDWNSVTRWKRIDINKMQISEDGLKLNFLNCRSEIPSLHNFSGQSAISEPNITTELCSELSSAVVEDLPSSFSCIVDEVFGIAKSESPLVPKPIQLNNPTHFSTLSVITYPSNPGVSSSMWDSGMQLPSSISDFKLTSSSISNHNNTLCLQNDPNMEMRSNYTGLFQSCTESTSSVKIISKSEQGLPSTQSPNSCDVNSSKSTGDGWMGSLSDSKEPAYGGVPFPSSSQPLYPKPCESNSTISGHIGYVKVSESQTQDPDICHNLHKERRKRSATDMLNLIPSLQKLDVDAESKKRLKTTVSSQIQISSSHATDKGGASSCVYVSVFLHVLRHCSLCIKSAILTMQMQALGVAYIEEVGVQNTYSNLWFRLPLSQGYAWSYLCLQFGAPGSMCWDVKIKDPYFSDIQDIENGNSVSLWGSDVHIANISCIDSHMCFDMDGVLLSYKSIESDSIKKLVADIHRLSSAKIFALSMRKILGVKEGKADEGSIRHDSKTTVTTTGKGTCDVIDEKSHEHIRQTFQIDAVGLTSVWFSFESGVLVRFVVEWESGKDGCTVHVSPDQIWPHTKFLEDFVNGGDVASLLDCISLTAGPLNALSGATRPARATTGAPISAMVSALVKQGGCNPFQGNSPSTAGQTGPVIVGNSAASTPTGSVGAHGFHGSTTPTSTSRGGPGIVPSSLLPIDVSVVLRGPYWIRIMYRKHFAVDMRCFAGDQVWLQPATPPKAGPSFGGSLPCPQFRPFIMEHVAHELNILEPGLGNSQQGLGSMNYANVNSSSGSQPTSHGNRGSPAGGISKVGNSITGLSRTGNSLSTSPILTAVCAGASLRRSPCLGANLRGDLNTTIIGLGDDGGYGGGWVPLVALKKVLRGILKYLGVLWLFAQLPNILKEVLGSILKDNEGALLNLDQEQPALRFFIGGYVFAVSVHRVQLLLQILSVKRFHQLQLQQNPGTAQEELSQSEIAEISDYFCHRVALEPYDISRAASFVTLLTLPISILREFLKLIAWKRGPPQSQTAGDLLAPHKPRVELCLDNHSGLKTDNGGGGLPCSNSNIHYNRPRNSVDFSLTLVLDAALVPPMNTAGGAAWLPYSVSVRLRYQFGETPSKVSFLWMEGSHGGNSCWLSVDEWDKCRIWVAQAVEVSNSTASSSSGTDVVSQGRLRVAADSIHKTLHLFLKGLRDGGGGASAAAIVSSAFPDSPSS